MATLRCCPHGRTRLRQRGFQCDDHDRIFLLGVYISDQEIVVPEVIADHEISLIQERIERRRRINNRDSPESRQEDIAVMKREIHQIERIRNRKIVVDDDVLVTGYRPTRRELQRCFRRLRTKASRMRRWR